MYRGSYRTKIELGFDMISAVIAVSFCSYVLGQIASYLQKVICAKKKIRPHSYMYGCFRVSGAEVAQFLSIREGGIFGNHDWPSGDQKFIQWNPVNMDTKGTCHSVRIIRVSVLSGLSEKMSGTHVLSI